MQIPTGIIADIWGPRRLLSLGSLVAGIGAMLFTMAPSLFWAGVGRFLFGGSVPVHLSGTVSGVVNMGVMIGPTILQPAIGVVLDQNWQGETMRGVWIYSLEAYQSGFLLMIVWLGLPFMLLFLTRETFCRQIESGD